VAALEAGFQSVFALPLRLRDATIGGLNLFSIEGTPMDEGNVIVARAFADLATISVLLHRAVTEAQKLNQQLSDALTSRIVIEQALGVIAERLGLSVGEAFLRLRHFARGTQRRLTVVAWAVVDGALDPSPGPHCSDRRYDPSATSPPGVRCGGTLTR